MAKYQKIAVAIDFSEQSKKALERGVILAKDYDAALQLIHVVDTVSFGSIAAYDLNYAGKLKTQSLSELETLKLEAKAQGVNSVEVTVEEGSAKAILTQLPDVDLIICGATGYNAMEKMVIGSVAEQVARTAKCDVLIVRL
ncbi:universal stress protein UspA [Ureibacillus massiliensis 4400831 = CIP 108448 = CCUG 49529]|uniref:Universal stress protein n=1 Tax=Ureibacillus massiliensis 4400831 = CIP 108448 = CCUG 49529 TaxID=1211035 RepID=A0A0A3J0B6_9BACL|nr:universal stress protein [Ureibacillus massiliensis]KGR90459.1 universal stress protein UspA [Ureibacillus massiliensis 4400831 = CIP 108448 = CCUG 49529]